MYMGWGKKGNLEVEWNSKRGKYILHVIEPGTHGIYIYIYIYNAGRSVQNTPCRAVLEGHVEGVTKSLNLQQDQKVGLLSP